MPDATAASHIERRLKERIFRAHVPLLIDTSVTRQIDIEPCGYSPIRIVAFWFRAYRRVFEDPVKLARAIHGALGKSRTSMEAAPASKQALDLDAAALEAALGQKGRAVGATYQLSILRAEAVQDMGVPVPLMWAYSTGMPSPDPPCRSNGDVKFHSATRRSISALLIAEADFVRPEADQARFLTVAAQESQTLLGRVWQSCAACYGISWRIDPVWAGQPAADAAARRADRVGR